MTPKEKAEELIRKYYTWGIRKEGQTLSWLESKQCALIAVDEIIEVAYWNNVKDFYREVKQEIQNL